MEGNTLSLGETRMVLRGMTISGKPFTEIQEIKNHPASIDLIKTLAFDRMTSITEHDILKLHKIALDKVIEDAGKYREDDYIAVKGAQFTPTSWHEISDDMEELLDFINKNPDGLFQLRSQHMRIISLAVYILFMMEMVEWHVF